MMLIEETKVPEAALPLGGFKAHLRLGTGFSDEDVQDQLLQSFLRAALAAIEARTGKILITRDFLWRVSEWRESEAQPLPVAPVSALLGFVLVTKAGDTVAEDPANYRLEPDSQRPRLRPAGYMLPEIPSGGQAELRFRAGYGPGWGDLPADLAQAVLLLAAHYYEYRNETALAGGCMPFGVTSLIEGYRTVRLLGGGRS